MPLADKIRQWAHNLKTQIYTVYFAARDPRTPWYGKALAFCTVAYAFSPIDLIPDFVPVLGYLDDVIILPLGIFITMKAIPPHVLSDCRIRARERIAHKKPVNWIAGAAIILIWLVLAMICAKLVFTAIAQQ